MNEQNEPEILVLKIQGSQSEAFSASIIDPDKSDQYKGPLDDEADMLLLLLSARDENLARTIMVKATELMSVYGMVEIVTKPGQPYDPTVHDDRGIEVIPSEKSKGNYRPDSDKGLH